MLSRRVAFAAAAVILGLSACGSPGANGSSSKPPVIHLVPGGSKAGGSETATGDAARPMMPVQSLTFVFDGSLPDLPATGHSWFFPANVAPDTARIEALAKALGISGDVRTLPAAQGGGWMVGPADYSGSNVTVSPDAVSSWWFNGGASAVEGVACGGGTTGAVPPAPTDAGTSGAKPGVAPDSNAQAPVPPDDPNQKPTDPCAQPTPPANVPSKDAALAAAKQLMTAMGYDVAGYEYDAYADEWNANVTAFLMLDGHRSPVMLSFGFGGDAKLVYASGVLAKPLPGADYPLVSAADAIARLNDTSGKWSAYGVWGSRTIEGGIAVDTKVNTASTVNAAGAPDQPPPATTPGGPTTGTALPGGESTTPGAPAPCDAPNVDCAYPIEPVPTTIHLNKVSLDMTMVYAQDGTIWLVPAFAFSGADGGVYSVLAVQDGYIDLPAPTPVPEPLPVETVPANSTPIATDPVAPPETVVPVGPPASTPGTPVAIDLATKVLQGLSESDAAAAAQSNGWELRVIERDGQPQVVTDDYRPNRVNVVVENGAVTAVKSIG